MKLIANMLSWMDVLRQSRRATPPARPAVCGAVMPRTNPPGIFVCALPAHHADAWHKTSKGVLGSANAYASWRDEDWT